MLTVIELPSLSSTMKKGKVVKWHKNEGDFVQKGETLFELQTDKVNVEVDSVASGFLRKILLPAEVEAPVHTPIAVLSDSMDEDISSVAEEKPPIPPLPVPEGRVQAEVEGARQRISPLARKIASEAGMDIQNIQGTGPGGRITREDVERAMAQRSKETAAPAKVGKEREPQREMPDFEDLEITPMRRIIAQRLQASKVAAPHFYVDITADATAITQLKEKLDKSVEEQGSRISLNDILIKIVAHALKEFPGVNASFLGDRIRVYKAVHMGVAVAVDEGLLVPVIRNADQKSIQQISHEAKELAGKARNRRLLPQEYEGGTFTLSNMGMFGVESFHAIINPPEGGILAAGAVIPKPVAMEGTIVVRPCWKLSLSVDHRVVDGALAARFLACVKELVETPALMLL